MCFHGYSAGWILTGYGLSAIFKLYRMQPIIITLCRIRFTALFSASVILILLSHTACKKSLLKTENANIERIKSATKNYLTTDWEKRLETVREIITYQNNKNNTVLKLSLLVATRDNHPEIRIEALKGLAQIKSNKALPRLKEMALSDPNDNVRWYAFKALTLYRDPGLINIFMQGLNDSDWLIREASLVGILALEDESVEPRIIDATVRALRTSNESIQITALENTRIKSPEIYREIRMIFLDLKDSEYTMLKASLRALEGYIFDREVRDRLVELLLHNNRDIRLMSLKVLKTELKQKK